MRITGGFLGGRRILVPKTALRPTQDRVRAAVFSSLGAQVEGARVLDIYAGSGAMGLEAYSRGAAFICWVESDLKVLRALRENVEHLCGTDALHAKRVKIVRDDAIRFLRRYEKQMAAASNTSAPLQPFDIILADPPYDCDGAGLKKLLSILASAFILQTGGMIVMEQDAKVSVADHEGWMLARNKAYGGTRICFFRKNAGKH